MIKLIVLDIDGTILNSKSEISAFTKKVIMQLYKEQIITVYASGRNVASVKKVLNQSLLYQKDVFIIGSNGQQIYNEKLKINHKDDAIPLKYVREIVSYAVINKLPLAASNHDLDKKYYFYPVGCIEKNGRSDDAINFNKETNFFIDETDFDKVSFLIPQKLDIYKIYHELLVSFSEYLEVFITSKDRIEFVGKNINKVNAINKIIKQFHIAENDVLVIGDSLNDLESLKTFKNSIAMGNAFAEVKAVSRIVTETNDEDGAAKGIVKYVFNKGSVK